MVFCLSDIHGCYDKYARMLKQINFTENDVLYVLGDVVDYGANPVKALTDMSMRGNIIPILGNHDHIAYETLKELLVEPTEGNADYLVKYYMDTVREWLKIGGEPTLLDFKNTPNDEREYLLEYISEFSLYETITVKGKRYILTHAGLPMGAAPKNLKRFDAYDFITAETDYDRVYFDDIFLVTGHMPTMNIDESCRGRIYRKNNHIAIDTGAVFGEAMGCICLDTGEEFYV